MAVIILSKIVFVDARIVRKKIAMSAIMQTVQEATSASTKSMVMMIEMVKPSE